jgi:hypothetical protein
VTYSNPIVAGDILIREAIKSENYVQGVSGWAIFRNGDAEFNDIVARGDITARSVIVPFVNQEGDEYEIRIVEQNIDQPNIEFAFTGTDIPNWDEGTFSVEAFDTPTGWGELNIQPLQPNNMSLGSPPSLRIQSNRADADAPGAVDFLASASISGRRPRFTLASAYDVVIPSMRPQVSALASNLARTTNSVGAFTATNGAGDVAEIFINRPASGSLNIRIDGQFFITANQGVIGFEIRDTNSAGTVRNAATVADSIIMSGTSADTQERHFDVFNIAGTSALLYVRVMYQVTVAATLTMQRLRLTVKPNP